MKDLRVALVQLASRPGDVHWNTDRIAAFAAEAAMSEVDIVCFPELAVTGYGRSAAMRALAEPVPGPTSQRLEDIARKTGVTVMAGLLEATRSGAVLNTHLVVTPLGLSAKYSKTHVPINERPAFGAGDHRVVFEHAKARCGVLICYDAHFPELSSVLTEDGAEVLFVPHASANGEGRREKVERWMRFLPARAYDNGVFVAVCNPSGTTSDGEQSPGIALVLDPFGRIVAMTEGSEEQMLVADLRAALLVEARGDVNGFMREYRRPELYVPRR
jgi:predicted amidohydrolase